MSTVMPPVKALEINLRMRPFASLAAVLVLLFIAIVCSLMLGSRPISIHDVIVAIRNPDYSNDAHLIIWELRIPRTIVAILTGAALGVSGALMQAITRNPLAEPGLLGVNAGAAAGIIIGISAFGLSTISEYVWFAFFGAGLAGVAVFLLGGTLNSIHNPVQLVLAGAGLTIVLGSITGILVINAPLSAFDQYRHWMAGSVEGRGYDVIHVLLPVIILGFLLAMAISASLDTLALGRDFGAALGVNIRLVWILACLAIMLLAGAATSGAGPVAFIGLIAPHLARVISGHRYWKVLTFSALIAANLLLIADITGRLVAPPSEIAAGIIALLVGGPFFVTIVRSFRLSKL